MTTTFAERVDQLIANKSRAEQFSGVVLVKQNENEWFKAAYGYANRTWRVESRVDTRFRIASISKLFTAAAVLQLIEEGKLSLDTLVAESLGLENTTIPKQATVHHMLTMTSGIADWFEESGDWEENWAALCREHPIYLFRRNQDYLPLFIDKPPLFPLGEKHQYNGAGYILLGLLIEKLSGLSYFDYIRRRIFEKAEMARSDFLSLDGVYEDVAEGYIPLTDQGDGVSGWKKNIYSTTPEAAADGGATSTADDLCRFSRALREGKLLSAKWTQEMLTPKVLERAERLRGYTWKYGYGNFFLLSMGDSEHVIRWGHTGEEDGVSCRLYYYPKQNLDVVLLGNQSWCAGGVAWEIHDLILELIP
jgi:CubicO group peptidase (beta-lactamase class C family)